MSALDQLTPIGADFTRASEAELAAIEAKLGFALPEAYRDFLRTRGGSAFHDGDALIGGELVFTMFDAAKVLDDIRAHEDYSAEALVPFADDMFNNRFVIASKQGGAVYFIDYDAVPPSARRIAETFDAFVGALQIRPFGES